MKKRWGLTKIEKIKIRRGGIGASLIRGQILHEALKNIRKLNGRSLTKKYEEKWKKEKHRISTLPWYALHQELHAMSMCKQANELWEWHENARYEHLKQIANEKRN